VWVGVIAIIFGGFGMLGGLIGMLTPAMLPFLKSLPGQAPGTYDAIERYTGIQVLTGALTMLTAALLLIGGIGLLRRSRTAARILVFWAVLKLIVVLGNVSFGALIQHQQLQDIQAAQPGPVPQAAMLGTMVVLTVVIGVLWGWALPVFMLIWMNRSSIKAETASWA
jgi:hypothetical protein